MKYKNSLPGIFITRPNRFIAHVEIDGKLQICHVKNTGRCRELLTDGVQVYVEESDNPNRKTKFDLISVMKGNVLINMDSQAPNKAVAEFLPNFFPTYTKIIPEKTYGKSRLDFYVETPTETWFIEVKGVTLENGGVAFFPDAPTERGVKHVQELSACMNHGYKAAIFFVIQMKGISCMKPNDITHPQFGDALRLAKKNGVEVLAFDCVVTTDSMKIDCPIPVFL